MIEFPRRREEGGELRRRRGNVVLILNCSQTMVMFYLNIETCDYYATMHGPPERFRLGDEEPEKEGAESWKIFSRG